jgi:hypothetical protein
VVPGAGTGSAQSINDTARVLDNVVNPGNAQRLEDQARRNDDLRRSVTGATIAWGWPLPAGIDAIMGVMVIDGKVTIATRLTKVFKAIATIEPIATSEISLRSALSHVQAVLQPRPPSQITPHGADIYIGAIPTASSPRRVSSAGPQYMPTR